tara:strand:+ start:58 stop:657 length:600 start_codon:yes stop_codon:yes gene_type:complete
MHKLPIIEKLNELVGSDILEGNCIYKHRTNKLRTGEDIDNLRFNLISLGEQCKTILEVGFNAGHSCGLMALKNKDIEFLIFDLGKHEYTQRCIEWFSENYNITYIEGNSNKTIPLYNSNKIYALIHIDGGHGIKTCENDIRNCKKFADNKSLLLVDDINLKRINDLIDHMIASNYIEEVEMNSMHCKSNIYHKLFRYVF